MVKRTLKVLQQMLQTFKCRLTIVWTLWLVFEHYPANIYLFKVTIETLEEGAKYV